MLRKKKIARVVLDQNAKGRIWTLEMDECAATIIGVLSLTDVNSKLFAAWTPDKQAYTDNKLLDQLLYEELRMILDIIQIIDLYRLLVYFSYRMPFQINLMYSSQNCWSGGREDLISVWSMLWFWIKILLRVMLQFEWEDSFDSIKLRSSTAMILRKNTIPLVYHG